MLQVDDARGIKFGASADFWCFCKVGVAWWMQNHWYRQEHGHQGWGRDAARQFKLSANSRFALWEVTRQILISKTSLGITYTLQYAPRKTWTFHRSLAKSATCTCATSICTISNISTGGDLKQPCIIHLQNDQHQHWLWSEWKFDHPHSTLEISALVESWLNTASFIFNIRISSTVAELK